MSDLISREALKDKYLCCGWLPEMSKDQFDAFPAVDAVEVVRCENCIYQKDATVNCKGFIICPVSNMEITDDDYCSYGERKESEDTQ